ncbi:MAG: lipopolysaccharide biosynthesis protein [Candidatus Jettenia sp.]|nr:MAG: lipopolysaccharide biosynthesis protein [Candidatus Jettenia sp.]
MNIKFKILTNTGFHISSQLITFGFEIVLARLLLPKDFGMYGVSFLIIELASYLTLRRFSVALIQIKEAREEHFSIVFYLNLFISMVLGLIIFFNAPLIEHYFNMPSLTLLLRWQTIALFIICFEVISSVRLLRELKFKELGKAEMFSVFVSGLLSTIFVYLKFGALSLVFGYLSGCLARVIMNMYYANRHQEFFLKKFNINALKDLYHVGFGVMVQQIFNYISGNIDYFLLGKLTSAIELGFYTRAYKIMRVPVSQISRNISRVLLPAFSRIQDSSDQITSKLFKATQATSLIVFPLFLMLYIYSEDLILFVYGEKWRSTIIPFRILIIAGAIMSISTYLGDVLKAKGVVYREVAVQVLQALILLFGGIFVIPRWGAMGMSFVVVFAATALWIFMLTILLSVLKKSILSYLKVFFPSIIICSLITVNFIIMNSIFPFNFQKSFGFMILGISTSFILYVCLILVIKRHCLLHLEIDYLQDKIFKNGFKRIMGF